MSEPAPTVFVIDDDPSIRRAIKRLVESVGLRVEALGSAKEFLGTEVPDGLRWRFSSMSLKGHLRSVAGTVFGRSVYLLR